MKRFTLLFLAICLLFAVVNAKRDDDEDFSGKSLFEKEILKEKEVPEEEMKKADKAELYFPPG